ncbi:MAG: hypothetical protein C5B50_26600 [Verrucomicrobia bacterium]|nr:MAG: hypothetical protein C5B50_26600 [Verrucomicrobiota bacterium]
MNRIFDADLRLEGVTDANELSIVTSEPWAQPADPRRPLPSSEEIASFMSDLGFALVPGAPFEWFRTRDRVRVSDARPDNFIKSKRGVVPIDLVISSE